MQAVILAGGKGTRLASRLDGRPKPLIPVLGRALLDRQLEALAGQGVDEAVVLVSHAAYQIARHLAGRSAGPKVRLVDDGEPQGTAGALLSSLDGLGGAFLVVYGDTLFDVDLRRMCAAHVASGADATLLLHPNDHPGDSDLVELDAAGDVRAFHAPPHGETPRRNLVNAALYVVERAALESWRAFPRPCDLARDLFPAMVRAGRRLHGYVSYEYVKDVGTPGRLDKAERHLGEGRVERASRRHRQRAVFLDRDGTLNALRGYVRSPDALELLPGAAAAVARLSEAEFRTVLVTNQPVLARGECTADDLDRIHAKLETELGREGAWLDAVYVCPHHPDGGFPGEVAELKRACACRKPAPGLILAAAADLNIDLGRSWFVGDSTSDVAAARAAGVRPVLVRTGEAGADGRSDASPDLVADDLAHAADLIVSHSRAEVSAP